MQPFAGYFTIANLIIDVSSYCFLNTRISLVPQVALDEEVSSEAVEAFRKQVARLRHPEHVLLHFALAPRSQPPPKHSQPKHHTLKYVPLKGSDSGPNVCQGPGTVQT